MQVILLQRIGRLGQMGDIVNVKNGYARNFLLPQKKALRATEDNKKVFEGQPRAARSRQPLAQEGSRSRCRQARRQDLRRYPRGRRHRPALRLGLDARHRRGDQRRRLHRRPQPGRARQADQDARTDAGQRSASPGGRRARCRSTSPARRTRPTSRPAARTSRSSRKRRSNSRRSMPTRCSRKAAAPAAEDSK